MHFLAQLQDDHGGAGVLAKRDLLLAGDACILQDSIQHITANRRFFFFSGLLQCSYAVRGQIMAGMLKQTGHGGRYITGFDFPHLFCRPVFIRDRIFAFSPFFSIGFYAVS
jgi:hypothetical protein